MMDIFQEIKRALTIQGQFLASGKIQEDTRN